MFPQHVEVVMAVKLVKRVFENGFGSIQGLPNWLLVAVVGPQNVQPFLEGNFVLAGELFPLLTIHFYVLC